jgi:hypothetical protein
MTLIKEVSVTLEQSGKTDSAKQLMKNKNEVKAFMIDQGWTVDYILANKRMFKNNI